MRKQLIYLTAVCSFLYGVCTTPAARSQSAPARFDLTVRNDIFAGFAGDAAALERGLARAAEVLQDEPNHAEAMAWLGSGKAFQAGAAFRKGDMQAGMTLWKESLELMNRAVDLAPDRVGVRIPRGATLAAATRGMPLEMAKPLVAVAMSDYRRAYELQEGRLESLSEHARGELLMGLADLAERNGEDWRGWARRVVETMPAESGYHRRASAWLEKGESSAGGRTCLGCHVDGK